MIGHFDAISESRISCIALDLHKSNERICSLCSRWISGSLAGRYLKFLLGTVHMLGSPGRQH